MNSTDQLQIDPDTYRVKLIPLDEINPSPENDEIYGEIEYDAQMDSLIDSIRKRGLAEPILLTDDRFILSGHRRYFALSELGYSKVPCRFNGTTREGNETFHSYLAEYNPQRIKSVGSLLKEALLRDRVDTNTSDSIRDYEKASFACDVDYMAVNGQKYVKDVSEKRLPFLEAVKKVVESLKDYLPISIRQIHYNILNDPPLTLTPKKSDKPKEHYRYRNDESSYKKLISLLKSARYYGHVPMDAIDDATRPRVVHSGWPDVDIFIRAQIDEFLTGYHRDRQEDQPRHIEILGEKNTLMPILKRVSEEYYVPLTLGRGFCSVPVWRDMAYRFRESGKSDMTLVIVSDYDPEGLELADDAIRSLRDLWGIEVQGHRVGVTPEQISELDLAESFNTAKKKSSLLQSFVKRTGGTKTWECEALPASYLEDQVRVVIEACLDMSVFNGVLQQEEEDCYQLSEAKQSIAEEMNF